MACARDGTPGRLALEGPYIVPLLPNAVAQGYYADTAVAALAILEAQHAASIALRGPQGVGTKTALRSDAPASYLPLLPGD